jgi:methylglutaconyl-CoA hydratase
MSGHVQLKIESGAAWLTLDRPEKRNALRREIIEELLDCVQQVSADEDVRVLVMQATGKVFCAGMDLGQMQERARSANAAAEWQQDSQVYCDLLCRLVSLDIPVVACVQGPALAGGMGLVLACDMVIATEDTFFMLPEPMRGITAAMVTPLLLHRVGPGPASWMLLSNERVAAGNSFGLCHAVVPADKLESRCHALIAAILGGSRSALAITKDHIRSCLSSDLPTLLRQSMEVSARARSTDDAREGLAAFLEKRKPAWQIAEE